MSEIVICALYKFVRLDNFKEIRDPLLKFMLNHNIRGTLLLASEGINGTVAGSRAAIDALLDYLQQDERLTPISFKESFADSSPFLRTKVKLKKEIVTMGVEGIDPNHVVGTYVKPAQWNQLISEEDVLLIDTRNDYEVQVGTFQKAINPNTESFREFPNYVKQHLDPQKHKRVAMFCTGGIRCEKSTAYLKEQGFDEVYHLEGGILKYLEEVPAEESMWEGECFVFDERVTVDHHLERGHYDQCHACRLPITEEEKQSPLYEAGISCPHCYDKTSEAQKARFREREKQIQLSRQRGEAHIGMETAEVVKHNREAKQLKKEQDRRAAAKKQHR